MTKRLNRSDCQGSEYQPGSQQKSGGPQNLGEEGEFIKRWAGCRDTTKDSAGPLAWRTKARGPRQEPRDRAEVLRRAASQFTRTPQGEKQEAGTIAPPSLCCPPETSCQLSSLAKPQRKSESKTLRVHTCHAPGRAGNLEIEYPRAVGL